MWEQVRTLCTVAFPFEEAMEIIDYVSWTLSALFIRAVADPERVGGGVWGLQPRPPLKYLKNKKKRNEIRQKQQKERKK